jgi:succinate-semialdehyde dehydrogenase/glutarate-semialdehyde dehydrogenase
MSGNVTLLKHAPNVIGCAKAIENAFWKPVFQKVFSTNYNRYSSSRKCHCVKYSSGHYFNGSEMAGSAVASLAGKHIKNSSRIRRF